MAESVITYLSLGSNMGDRLAALEEALQILDAEPLLRLASCSSVYETEPWGVVDQPAFLNLAAGFATELTPLELLIKCQYAESSVGRVASYRWGPRLIDVDILLYGDQQVTMVEPDLQIPHARMRERAFVLAPLAEIAGHVEVPPDGAKIDDLLGRLGATEGVTRWGQVTRS